MNERINPMNAVPGNYMSKQSAIRRRAPSGNPGKCGSASIVCCVNQSHPQAASAFGLSKTLLSRQPVLCMIKDVIADHFSGNPQAGCRVTYPISRLYGQVEWICKHAL